MFKIFEKKDEDDLVYAVQKKSNPHAWKRILLPNNLLSCQEFQGLKNTKMQPKVPSKSAQTKVAKEKHDKILRNYLEITEDEKRYLRPRFTRSQHQSLQKEE